MANGAHGAERLCIENVQPSLIPNPSFEITTILSRSPIKYTVGYARMQPNQKQSVIYAVTMRIMSYGFAYQRSIINQGVRMLVSNTFHQHMQQCYEITYLRLI